MPNNKTGTFNVFTGRLILMAIAASLLLSGCAGRQLSPVDASPDKADAGKPGVSHDTGKVEKGDLVKVNYTVTLDDGSLVSTTLPALAWDNKVARSSWFELPKELVPGEVLAGEKGAVPGLGEGVLDMTAGEKKRVALLPGKAYGERDERKVNRQQRENKISRTIRIPAKEFVDRFNTFPIVGKEVPFVPYVTARVGEVNEADMRMDVSATDGARFEESFGTVEVHVAEDAVTLRLNPKIGASLTAQGEQGRVTTVDDDSYTVDFNHPLAGKKVNVDLELVSLVKRDSFKEVSLSWQEDHDRGLAAAKQAGKPAVLVLYAEWCQWCKKLFAETAQDPRIKELKDSFVWIRVNSNQQTEYKAKYGQNGFPMIVLLNADGTVSRKIEGFRDGAALAGDLREFLADGGRKPVL